MPWKLIDDDGNEYITDKPQIEPNVIREMDQNGWSEEEYCNEKGLNYDDIIMDENYFEDD